jgi:predicted esterase
MVRILLLSLIGLIGSNHVLKAWIDTIVHPSNLLAAKDFLQRKKIEVETNLLENCEHSIPAEAISSTIRFLKKNLNNS